MNLHRLYPIIALAAALVIAAGYFSSAKAAIAPRYQIVNAATGRTVERSIATISLESLPAAVVVSQKSKTFSPATVEIHVGQTLEITNDDQTVHNAYCQAPDFKYNAGAQAPGSTSKVTFTAPGAYEVRCAIHPKMVLHVKVIE